MSDGRQGMHPGIEEMERLRLRRFRQMAQFRQNRDGFIAAFHLLSARTATETGADQDIQPPISRRRNHEAVHFIDDSF